MRFSTPTSLRTAVALGASAALAAGCSKEFYTGIPDVDRVEVSVAPRVINVNSGAVAIGTPFNGNNPVNSSRAQVTYKSDNPDVAFVNPNNGAITGLAPGVAHIIATARGKEGRDSVVVRLVPARSVVIGTRNPRFRVGATNSLGAAAYDSANQQVPAGRIVFRSTNEAVLGINATTGIVTPRTVGTVQVIASVDNGLGGGPSVADTVTAVVTPVPIGAVQVTPLTSTRAVGETQQYTLTLTDSLGAAVTGRAVTWVSSNTAVATVDGNGLAAPVAPGGATISAVLDRVPGEPTQVSGGAGLTVTPAPAARIDANPSSVVVRAGASQTVVLTVRDANGNELFGRSILATPTPSDQSIAAVSVNSDGVRNTATIRGVGAGSASVTFQVIVNGQLQGAPVTVPVTVSP